VTTRPRRRKPALLSVPVLFAGVALSACGTTTIDPKSGEDLIRNDVNRIGAATVKSVSCPSGQKPNDGATFNCKVTLVDKATGTTHSGTITVHVTGGGKKVEFGTADVHIQ